MLKTIRVYDVETVSGVAKFIRGYRGIYELAHDHRANARDAIIDMKAAIKKAGLDIGERFVVAKVSATGNKVYGAEKCAFFSACEKIAGVFKAEGYGLMEITRFTH